MYASSNHDAVRQNTGGSDQTMDYGLTPTSASPPHSSPSMTESTSNSLSNSSSPPEPTTPPQASRNRTRYPDLGRVPRHRRGTSKKYETLEDLLKEAGYKETRIFTPESERSDGHRNINGVPDDKRLSMKDGMEAVVGFFANLIPSAAAARANLNAPDESSEPMFTTSPQAYSPPQSPLTQRYTRRNGTQSSFESRDPTTPTNVTSSIESLTDPTPKAISHHSYSHSNSPAPTITQFQEHSPLIIRHGTQLRSQTSRSSISRSSNNNIASPRPSRAGAYLRHMSSIQNMPERPNSTPVHSVSRPRIHLNDEEITCERRGNGEGESIDEPPLPPSWLESVARAVLFGGSGAYVGGPAQFAVSDHSRHASGSAASKPPRVQVLRPTRSSLSQASSRRPRQPISARSGLSDQTNTRYAKGDALLVPPPPLLSKIERGRAGRSEGEVSRTRVLCRSAPGSRMGSPVRDGAKEKLRERGRGKRKNGENGRLPSLARTHVEGDMWAHQRRDAARKVDPYGAEGESESDSQDAGAPSSDDEDDGELNLARILVPPKRQNSIKSLRKHLGSDAAGQSGQGTLKHIASVILPGSAYVARSGVHVVNGGPPSVVSRVPAPRRDDTNLDGEFTQEWGAGWTRRGRGSQLSDDDELESSIGLMNSDRAGFGSGRSNLGKRRTGFNAPWGS